MEQVVSEVLSGFDIAELSSGERKNIFLLFKHVKGLPGKGLAFFSYSQVRTRIFERGFRKTDMGA